MERADYIKDLGAKLKNEAYIQKLQGEGVNVEALRNDLKKKENGSTVEGVSKQGI